MKVNNSTMSYCGGSAGAVFGALLVITTLISSFVTLLGLRGVTVMNGSLVAQKRAVAALSLRGSNGGNNSNVGGGGGVGGGDVRNPSESCRGLSAALLWDDEYQKYARSSIEGYDGEYDFAMPLDMNASFGAGGWVEYTGSSGSFPTTAEELMKYDVIVVEGGGPAWEYVQPWLQNGGAEILETVAAAGVGVYINAGGWTELEGKIPFGLIMEEDHGQNRKYGRLSNFDSGGNPLVQGPFSPVAEEYFGLHFSWARVKNPEDMPNFQVLIEDSQDPSLAIAVGGMTASGSHVLVSGTSHTGTWAVSSSADGSIPAGGYDYNAEETVNLRLNMLDYVCSGLSSRDATRPEASS